MRIAAHLLPCALLSVLATSAMARTLEVGAGRPYQTPSQAAAAAVRGDRIVIAPGRYVDCAVWRQSDLVIEGSGPETVIAEATCQGKGIFVISGDNVTVRGLTLTGARVADANGAGIRAEGNGLRVAQVRFIDNENGILFAGVPRGSLLVQDSEFIGNGSCERECAHGIYVGPLELLRIERSRFTGTRAGHHIKSRALRTEILDSEILDGPSGTASYLIDVPNGGAVLVANNRLQKGPRATNRSAAISIGAEGVNRPTPEIRIEGNEFRADGGYATVFVVNLTATAAQLRGNRIAGPVRPLQGDGTVAAGRPQAPGG
jgi:hypothetical protein